MNDRFVPHNGWLMNSRYIIGVIPPVRVKDHNGEGWEVGLQIYMGGGNARVLGQVFANHGDAVDHQVKLARFLLENVG